MRNETTPKAVEASAPGPRSDRSRRDGEGVSRCYRYTITLLYDRAFIRRKSVCRSKSRANGWFFNHSGKVALCNTSLLARSRHGVNGRALSRCTSQVRGLFVSLGRRRPCRPCTRIPPSNIPISLLSRLDLSAAPRPSLAPERHSLTLSLSPSLSRPHTLSLYTPRRVYHTQSLAIEVPVRGRGEESLAP